MTTSEYVTHWNHSRPGKVVVVYDDEGLVSVKVHTANNLLCDKVRDKQSAEERLGLRLYSQKMEVVKEQVQTNRKRQRFPNGQAPEGEGWEEMQTDEEFAADQEELKALIADDSIPTLPKGEWECEGYPWYWREAGLEWDGKDTAKVFVGCSPPTKSTIFSAGHGPRFDGNSVLLQRRKDEHGAVQLVCVSGAMPTETGHFKEVVVKCNTLQGRDIREYVSPLGNNDVPYHYAIDTAGAYYLFAENMVATPTPALEAIIAHQKKTVAQEQAAAAAARAAAADEGKEAPDPEIHEDHMFEPYTDFLYRVTQGRGFFPTAFVESVLGRNTRANSTGSVHQTSDSAEQSGSAKHSQTGGLPKEPAGQSSQNTAVEARKEVEFDPCTYLCEHDAKRAPAEVFLCLPPQYSSVADQREIKFMFSRRGFDAQFDGIPEELHEKVGEKKLRLVFKEVIPSQTRNVPEYKELCWRDINREEYERIQVEEAP